MLIRHFAEGRAYLIQAPDRSAVARRSHRRAGVVWLADILFIPTDNGGVVGVPSEPPSLLLRLAELGAYGLRLVAART
jgi:hypothetical protein